MEFVDTEWEDDVQRYHILELISCRKGRRAIFAVKDLRDNTLYFMKMER